MSYGPLNIEEEEREKTGGGGADPNTGIFT